LKGSECYTIFASNRSRSLAMRGSVLAYVEAQRGEAERTHHS
jgi:hypothetical protein